MNHERWTRISALFERALELPAEQREAFVFSEASGDEELVGVVHGMLRHDAADQLLDRDVESLAAALIDVADVDPFSLDAGDRVGDYEVLGILGRGGMGIVYRARDTRLGRLAALKFLPVPRPHAAATDRMEAEARAASALDHPNIATIYHVGTAEGGRPYIAMAHYDGETLAQRLERGTVEPGEGVRIAIGIASGLAAAHDRGIVHRDVKPSNVLLPSTGGVKLLDFGIAADAGAYLAGSASGTRRYMSPEQARAAAPHPSSDVWSLGAVLCEMLTGLPPAGGDLPPGHNAVPVELRAVIRRALAPDPAARYPDARAMLAELEPLSSPTRPADTNAVRLKRSRVTGVSLVAGLVVAVAAWTYSTFQNRARIRAAPVSVVAVFPFELQGDSVFGYLREGMVDLLSSDFDGVGGLRSVDPRAIRTALAGNPAASRDPRLAARVAAKLGAGRVILGQITATGAPPRLRATAALYDSRGQLETSAQSDVVPEDRIFEVVDLLAGRLLAQQDSSGGDLRLVAAATTSSLPALKAYLEGEQLFRGGRFEAAAAAFERAVALDTSFALANYGLAWSAWWTDHNGFAREPAMRALRQSERLPRSGRLQLEGLLARFDGDLDRAERIYRQLVDLAPNDVDSWFGLADVLHHFNPIRGRALDEAEPYFERALALQSDNMSVRLHLANMAARRQEYARHDSLVAGLPATGRYGLFVRLVRAFATNDQAAQERVAREFRGAEDRTIGEGLHYIVRLAHNPAAGVRFLELAGQPAQDGAIAQRHFLRAGIELTLGRWDAAARELRMADSMGHPVAIEAMALWSLAPFLPPDTTRWRELRALLARRERSGSAARRTAQQRATSAYLRGLLSARVGDRAIAERLVDTLEERGRAGESFATAAALSIRAQLALLHGDSTSALNLLEQLQPRATIDALQEPALGFAFERFVRAELLRAAGRAEEALAWYRGQLEASTLEAVYLAPSHFRSAQLLLAKRDPAAAAHERLFRELWATADSTVAVWGRP